MIDNDADARNRYYITDTSWFGKGDTNSNPIHDYTDVYHAGETLASNGNTFMWNFNPQDENPGGHPTYAVGYKSAQISWSQDRPAQFRYGLYDTGMNGYDAAEYAMRAKFADVVGANTQYTGQLDYAATGVVPTGSNGYMWIRMIHHSWANGWGPEYNDDTDWHSYPMYWS